MTPEEFVLWLDGFCESLIGLPNENGWARIEQVLDDTLHHLHASREKPIIGQGGQE